MEKVFNPNIATFEDGERRVELASKKAEFQVSSKVITSQDKEAIRVVNLLGVDNVPPGFKKWQLPFVMKPSQLFISVANPDVSVPEHSHDEGNGIRFIISGSIYYNGKELKAGDWMFIPKGSKYTFKVGPFGASFCYCYECCCGGKELGVNWIIDPAPFQANKNQYGEV